MTRYVGEPSQERKAVQGRWGVEDLRRRPGTGSSSIWAWIRSQNRVIEGAGATYHNPFYIPTGTLTSGQSDAAVIQSITTETTSNEIRAYVPGIYLAEFDANFVLAFTATVDYRLLVDGGTHVPPIVTSFLNDERPESDGHHGMNRMVFISNATAEVPVRFSATILQASGSDKTISDARLMVTRLASL